MYDRLLYFCGEWEGWVLINRFNHTSGVIAVTPTDRPKSVRNRCEFEVLVVFFYVVTLLFGFFCGCRGFCHRTESDLFLFSHKNTHSIDDSQNLTYHLLVSKWFWNLYRNIVKHILCWCIENALVSGIKLICYIDPSVLLILRPRKPSRFKCFTL